MDKNYYPLREKGIIILIEKAHLPGERTALQKLPTDSKIFKKWKLPWHLQN